MTHLLEAKEGQNPSSAQEGGAGLKISDQDPQIPSFPVNICSFISAVCTTHLLKKQLSYSPEPPALPLRAYYPLSK